MNIFVDTAGLVALADRSDNHHRRARGFLRSLDLAKGSLVTSDYILDETITKLRFTIGQALTLQFIQAILDSQLYTIVGVDEDVRRLAWEWFRKYHDKPLSFTDCTSFVIMKTLKLDTAFTFDQDFSILGFNALPVVT